MVGADKQGNTNRAHTTHQVHQWARSSQPRSPKIYTSLQNTPKNTAYSRLLGDPGGATVGKAIEGSDALERGLVIKCRVCWVYGIAFVGFV
jgi:hypothetical protein